jgi:hypothetical protein
MVVGKMWQRNWCMAAFIAICLAGCDTASPKLDPARLQSIASAGCQCMKKDPQHRWWSRESQKMGEPNPPCWAEFDEAVANLDVTEEPVAACGPGSEGVPLTVRGHGMAAQGSPIFLRYAFGACTAQESADNEREFEREQAHSKSPIPSC